MICPELNGLTTKLKKKIYQVSTGPALKPARRDILKTKKRYKLKVAAKEMSSGSKRLIFDDRRPR